jgi:type II secretory pathway pseudopilin PulG
VITHRLKRYLSATRTSAGLTLIECLVAIVMVGLIGSAIAPALLISVATRVQSQKAEQALELAQSEIDKVRQIMERGEYEKDGTSTLPEAAPFDGDDYKFDYDVAKVNPPDKGEPLDPGDYDYYPNAFQTQEVELNGERFAVQVYRTPGKPIDDGVPVTFNLGVRVYDYDAVVNSDSLQTKPAALSMVSSQGQRTDSPLVALYTTVTASDGATLCSYIQHLDTDAQVPTGCN